MNILSLENKFNLIQIGNNKKIIQIILDINKISLNKKFCKEKNYFLQLTYH